MTKHQPKWIPRELRRLIKRFRVLDDWKIEYDTQSEYKAQSCANPATKQATIYEWPKKDRPRPVDYFLHEVLHIVFAAVTKTPGMARCYARDRELEEESVRDICALFGKHLKRK